MNVRQSVMGEVAVRTGLDVSGADVEGLLWRLLLFDSVIIKSVRLRELPFLVRVFGKDGFCQLLDSGVLKMTCEFATIASAREMNGVRIHPLYTFTFGMVDIGDREGVLRSELRRLQGVSGLKNPDREAVEDAVLTKLVRPPAEFGDKLLSQFESDLRSGTPALELSIRERLKVEFGDSMPAFQLNVEETVARTFHIANNISKTFGISEERTDDILNGAVNAVGHLNHRIADMAAYSAITGFAEHEAPLLFGKLTGILKPLNPGVAERQFARVASIANCPVLVPGKRIDIDRLLAARDSAELREFRDWVSRLEGLTDDQVRDMIGGVRQKIGFLIRSGAARTLRLAATTAVGFAMPITGVTVGIFDTFLLEKLFPSSGVFAFLTKTYPSLFVSS
jgi:hypothetical protein